MEGSVLMQMTMMDGLTKVFVRILNMSLTGVYVIGLVLLARLLLRRAPRWCSYLLWGIVFLRLSIPVFPESTLSLVPNGFWITYETEDIGNRSAVEEISRIDAGNEITDGSSAVNMQDNEEWAGTGSAGGVRNWSSEGGASVDGSGGEYAPGNGGTADSGKDSVSENSYNAGNHTDSGKTGGSGTAGENARSGHGGSGVLPLLACVWLVGMLGILGYQLFCYQRFQRQLKSAVEIEKGIYEIRGEHLSFVMGILKPAIYLSGELEGAARQAVLCHEQIHLRRKDYLFKPAALVITCIHWFNPFVWWAFYLMNVDCEISCDEKVVSILGEESKKVYSYALLDEATRGQRLAGKRRNVCTLLSFGEDNIKNRVRCVLRFRKAPAWLLAGAVMIVVLLAVCLCSNARVPLQEQEASGQMSEQEVPGAEKDAAAGSDDVGNNGEGNQDAAAGSDDLGSNGAENQDAKKLEADRNFQVQKFSRILEDAAGNSYQVSDLGIYKVTAHSTICLYPDSIPVETDFRIYDNLMYFPMDSQYRDGDLDWHFDSICELNTETGAYRYLPLPKDVSYRAGSGWFSVIGGFVFLGEDEITALQDAQPVREGKTVFEMSREQQNAYGSDLREELLANPSEMVKIGNRGENLTMAVIDLDGDSVAEQIVLEPRDEHWNYYPYDNYRLRVGDFELEDFGCRLYNEIWAWSPDGEHIYLALYEDGPSWDPVTTFYRYEEGRLAEAGTIGNDVETLQIENGILSTRERQEVIQTDYIKV